VLQEGVLGVVDVTPTGQISNVAGVSINEDVVKLVEWFLMSMTIMIVMTCFMGGKVFNGLSPCERADTPTHTLPFQ
jgi:hypothetical protein